MWPGTTLAGCHIEDATKTLMATSFQVQVQLRFSHGDAHGSMVCHVLFEMLKYDRKFENKAIKRAEHSFKNV